MSTAAKPEFLGIWPTNKRPRRLTNAPIRYKTSSKLGDTVVNWHEESKGLSPAFQSGHGPAGHYCGPLICCQPFRVDNNGN